MRALKHCTLIFPHHWHAFLMFHTTLPNCNHLTFLISLVVSAPLKLKAAVNDIESDLEGTKETNHTFIAKSGRYRGQLD